MLLTKDGITVDHNDPEKIARLKALGYKEVQAVAPASVPAEKSPAEQNAEAIAEVNKKKKGGEK